MERLRVRGPNDALIGGSHIHKFTFVSLTFSGYNSCSCRNRLHQLQNRTIILCSLTSDGKPHLSTVAIHGPNGHREQRTAMAPLLITFQCNPKQPVLHFFGQEVSGHCEFQ
eukprot:Gb_30982 [translate_table: standard]